MTTKELDFKRHFQDNARESDTSKNWLFTEIAHSIQVSTCYRASSAMGDSGWYYETYIFESGKNGGGRRWIGDVTGRMEHFEVVRWIMRHGEFNQDKFDRGTK